MLNNNEERFFGDMHELFSNEDGLEIMCAAALQTLEANHISSWSLGMALMTMIRMYAAGIRKMSDDERDKWIEDNIGFMEGMALDGFFKAIAPYMMDYVDHPDFEA